MSLPDPESFPDILGRCEHLGDRATDHTGATHSYALPHRIWLALRVRPKLRSSALVRLFFRHARDLGVGR
jgi:hypothetical protein